ncbi:hypothetical protein [Streptomyces sp. CC228A]|uniref:hypothetical protein n=1 Tax=Streptomyces sp. CC228A TaxID=2898186 RepID=UPI001F2089CD|nr:hypothetical protein [Streptomyces sp. CC228A]
MAVLTVLAYGTLALTAGAALIALAPATARGAYVLPAVRTLAALLTIAALAAALLT